MCGGRPPISTIRCLRPCNGGGGGDARTAPEASPRPSPVRPSSDLSHARLSVSSQRPSRTSTIVSVLLPRRPTSVIPSLTPPSLTPFSYHLLQVISSTLPSFSPFCLILIPPSFLLLDLLLLFRYFSYFLFLLRLFSDLGFLRLFFLVSHLSHLPRYLPSPPSLFLCPTISPASFFSSS